MSGKELGGSMTGKEEEERKENRGRGNGKANSVRTCRPLQGFWFFTVRYKVFGFEKRRVKI